MKRAFTLIELLVVIAVIAILAAILFPLFAIAREKSRQSNCQSNMKQLGLAFILYSEDNDGNFMSPYYFGFVDAAGGSPLEPYIKNHGANSKATVWICPDVSAPSTKDKYYRYGRSYAMNEFLISGGYTNEGTLRIRDADSFYPRVADETAWYENGTDVPVQNCDHPISVAAIAQVSSTCLVFEAMTENAAGSSAKYNSSATKRGSWFFVKGFWNSLDAEKKYWYEANRPDAAYHIGNSNYAFCDGHVKAMQPEKQGYDISMHPQDNIWLTHDGRNGGKLPTIPH